MKYQLALPVVKSWKRLEWAGKSNKTCSENASQAKALKDPST